MAVCITPVSCTAQVPACSMRRRWRCWNARGRCRRRHRNLPAQKSRSWCPSATAFANGVSLQNGRHLGAVMRNSRLQEVPERDAANHQLVLRVLQPANAPMTAYEILHALRRSGFHSPPTVYRALKRLMDSGDVHRLESTNAYLSCSNHKHHHGPVAFAICRECGHVDELVGGTLTKQLEANAKQHGFRVEAAMIQG